MDDERLGDDVFYSATGVERGEGILKDDLHIASELPHFTAADADEIVALVKNRSGGGFDEAQDQSAERALPGAGFANESERFAGMNLERNVIDCADFPSRLAAKGRIALVENLR